MQKPWLIQRCRLGKGKLVVFEDMGSSEFEVGRFEVGSRTESLKRIFAKGIRSGSCAVHVGNRMVAVFMVAGEGFVFTDYQTYLQQLVDGSLRLQEWTNFDHAVKFEAGLRTDVYQTNTWFDIQNDVLWTLTRDNLEVLVSTLMSVKFQWSQEVK